MKNTALSFSAPSDAMDLVVKCGFLPYLDGCFYAARAVDLFADGCSSFMAIYRTVASDSGIKPKSVMRSIAYAISQAPDLHVKLSELSGTDIPQYLLHNSLVISYLGLILRRYRSRF